MRKLSMLFFVITAYVMFAMALGTAIFMMLNHSEKESKVEYALVEKYKTRGTFYAYDYDFIVKDPSGKKKHISVDREDYLLVKKGDKVDGHGDLIQ